LSLLQGGSQTYGTVLQVFRQPPTASSSFDHQGSEAAKKVAPGVDNSDKTMWLSAAHFRHRLAGGRSLAQDRWGINQFLTRQMGGPSGLCVRETGFEPGTHMPEYQK
jgi:hypothetical protein